MKKMDNRSVLLFRRVIFLVICCISIVLQAGCANISRVEAPIFEETTHAYSPGKFVWHDLVTSDVDSAKKFYGTLFNWTFEQNGRYSIVMSKGSRIGGFINVTPNPTEPHAARWISSLSVPDVDQAVSVVLANGGKVYRGPEQVEGRGKTALVSDPQGAQFALIRTQSGDPVDGPVDNGSWLWHELWTSKLSDSAVFYKSLAGYSEVEQGDDYWILKSGEKWRAGIRKLFNKALEQRWVPVIRVQDVATISSSAAALGGKVLIEPENPDALQVALLADPSGALFMVQEWSGNNDPEGEDIK